MKVSLLKNWIFMLTFAFIFTQCSDPHERYETPPWLGGTNIQTLEKEGNYKHFIALMDKAEYRISIENQMFTLFVPNDSCFQEYFNRKGIGSTEDLTREEAEELFGQHILVNPRSRDQLMYEYAWNELQDGQGEYGTLFNRKQTYSVPIDYSEEVRYNETFQGQTLRIYRTATFIPLFTTEFFQDYFGATDGSDYIFMYPESSWSGTQWHDAMVTESEVRTSSGFIYYIDRVVDPIPTIEKYLLDNQDKFSLYYDLAQRFARYTDPRLNEQQVRRYKKGYNQISNFAEERGSGDPGNAPTLMLDMFSSFIPLDHILQEYLDNTIFKYYETIDSVPDLYLVYLLQSHLNTFLNLPSKIDKQFINYYGDNIEINTETDISTSIMCSNGIIYAMNKILEPDAFTCVPGPIFYNSNYTTFLYALDLSGLLTGLTQPEIDVTLFAADNDELLEYGIRTNEDEGDVSIEIRASDGIWKPMELLDLQDFVRDYVYMGRYEDFNTEGYIRMASDNYVYYNNGKIYGGGNQVEGDYCTVDEKIPSQKNGNLFYLNNSIKAAINAAEYIMADPDLTLFTELLAQAGLIDSVQEIYEQPGIMYPRIIFMPELTQWTVLAPNNEAIDDAKSKGLIPTDELELRNFLYYHFARNKTVFDDGNFSGTVATQKIDTVIGSEIIYETLNFSNNVYNLNVQDKTGKMVNVNHADANILIENGVIHKITSILSFEP